MLALNQSKPVIPAWLIWIQCIAFVVLYSVWILPEIVGVRNTALVVGAIAGLYPLYQYRSALLQKTAIPIWLIVCLFGWATFHLLFLSEDYAVQLFEYKRIWKYAAIGGIFAFGLGLSLVHNQSKVAIQGEPTRPSWTIIYLGLCFPVLIYILKYAATDLGARFSFEVPPYLKIYPDSQPFYIPKNDYVAFCLPIFAISLGLIRTLLVRCKLKLFQFLEIFFYWLMVCLSLFVFFAQEIKNGMAHASFMFLVFLISLIFFIDYRKHLKKTIFTLLVVASLSSVVFYQHLQKNESWRSLLADAKVGLQTDLYQHWKYAAAIGYPENEYGNKVSVTNYERTAWFRVGVGMAVESPLGYGLIEDSFKYMAMKRWPDVSKNLSHSHSGWLDFILALGFPGFFCLFGSLVSSVFFARKLMQPWRDLCLWGLCANAFLWVTTEVSTGIGFCSLLFWISMVSGMSLANFNMIRR